MQQTPLTTLKYSAFLAGLYPSDPQTEAKIAEAKQAAGGETVVKRGFTGYDGDGASAKAIRFLEAAGIKSVRMRGPLCAVRVTPKTVNGAQANYLTVTVGTTAGKQFLSIDITNMAAQDLIRRLTDAEPGVDTEIALYAKYAQRDGQSRAFADHFASVKQNGTLIRGVNPSDMWPAIKAAQQPLEATGVADRSMLRAVADKVKVKWHLDLMPGITAKFESFYAQRPAAAAPASAPAPAATTPPPAATAAPAPVRSAAPAPAAPVAVSAPVVATVEVESDPFGLNDDEPVPPAPVVVTKPVPAARPAVRDPFTL